MRRIGESFRFKNIRLKVIEHQGCERCYFATELEMGYCLNLHSDDFKCGAGSREDQRYVNFIKVNKFSYGK